MLRAAILLPLLAGAQAPHVEFTETSRGYLYETVRAVVQFDPGAIPASERLEFVRLVDQGVADVGELVNVSPSAKLRFSVRHRTRISRAYGSRISLPYGRVASRSAPYLHETVHALLDQLDARPATWLSEGFASDVESYIAEHVGGYNAEVFFKGGNQAGDAVGLRLLSTSFGQAAYVAIGTRSAPEALNRDRENVARPFYALSQSLVKHLVENVSLESVVRLHQSNATELKGFQLSEWKRRWRASLSK